jgi:hypothetical protein
MAAFCCSGPEHVAADAFTPPVATDRGSRLGLSPPVLGGASLALGGCARDGGPCSEGALQGDASGAGVAGLAALSRAEPRLGAVPPTLAAALRALAAAASRGETPEGVAPAAEVTAALVAARDEGAALLHREPRWPAPLALGVALAALLHAGEGIIPRTSYDAAIRAVRSARDAADASVKLASVLHAGAPDARARAAHVLPALASVYAAALAREQRKVAAAPAADGGGGAGGVRTPTPASPASALTGPSPLAVGVSPRGARAVEGAAAAARVLLALTPSIIRPYGDVEREGPRVPRGAPVAVRAADAVVPASAVSGEERAVAAALLSASPANHFLSDALRASGIVEEEVRWRSALR